MPVLLIPILVGGAVVVLGGGYYVLVHAVQ
jgi:hypothetical protein